MNLEDKNKALETKVTDLAEEQRNLVRSSHQKKEKMPPHTPRQRKTERKRERRVLKKERKTEKERHKEKETAMETDSERERLGEIENK